MKRLFKIFCLLNLLLFPLFLRAEGKFLNPIDDICWSCIYPIHIAGANVTPKHEDYIAHKQTLCHCPGGLLGVPLSFWEPTRLIDVTHTPYKLVSFGGISLGDSNFKSRGFISRTLSGSKRGFYHVHYYHFPILSLLEGALDFICAEDIPIDIGYMSEFDPFWLDESWTTLLNPETLLFANPLAVSACIPDCGFSSFDRPTDKLFWCSGCLGSLYPLTGFVGHARGGVQASTLLVHRVLAKLHGWQVLKTFEEGNYCEKKCSRRAPKTAYKTQIAFPTAQTKGPCHPLGKTDLFWGSGKSYPIDGEDFVYVIWTQSRCCLDPYKLAKTAATGGAL